MSSPKKLCIDSFTTLVALLPRSLCHDQADRIDRVRVRGRLFWRRQPVNHRALTFEVYRLQKIICPTAAHPEFNTGSILQSPAIHIECRTAPCAGADQWASLHCYIAPPHMLFCCIHADADVWCQGTSTLSPLHITPPVCLSSVLQIIPHCDMHAGAY